MNEELQRKAKAIDVQEELLRKGATLVMHNNTIWVITTDGRKQFLDWQDLATTILTAAGIDTSKVCPQCGIRKPIADFTIDNSRPTRHYSWCRDCKNQDVLN